MAFKQVQCPNCFTEYAIPEEQLKVADGIIRCGTCRGQYRAIVLGEDHSPTQFDPRDVFIEPMSNPLEEDAVEEIEFAEQPEPSYVGYQQQPESKESEESKIELMSSHEFEYKGPSEAKVPEQVIEAYGNSDELSTSEILRNLRKKSSGSEDHLNESTADPNQTLIRNEPASITLITDSTTTSRKSDDELINEVDKLVDKKLTNHAGKVKQTESKAKAEAKSHSKKPRKSHHDIDDFLLEPRKSRRKQRGLFLRFIFFITKLVLVLVLLGALSYQLWLKQVFDIPEQIRDFKHPALDKVVELSEPYLLQAKGLAQEYGITFPQRKSLGMLELVSAQTEPHPTRDNTILLKISLINRAEIAQSLPWLEMSLMDSQGNLIARRNLSPEDYIYNNRTDASIGAKELKKITVELLSFPKNASGYEIKIIDR